MQFLLRSLILLSVIIAKGHAEEVKPTPEAKSSMKTESETAAKPMPEEKPEKDKKSTKKEKSISKSLPEMSMGDSKAPVTIIDYSSLTCAHCAKFHTNVLPKIEKDYIKPGYVRMIFRDYPGDQVSIKAHQVAWCRGEIKYLDFLKLLYETQEKWLSATDPVAALKSIALQHGITPKQFDTCLKNQELLDQIIQVRLEGQKKYNIKATPTIIINAKIYPRALSFEEFEEIANSLLEPTLEKAKKNKEVKEIKETKEIKKVKS